MRTLHTRRLLLREVDNGDQAALCRLFGDAEVMRFGDGPQGAAWVAAWVDAARRSYAERGYGPFAVVERGRGAVVGYCGLFFFAALNGRPEVELGYRLERAAWGRGLATEAAVAVRDYAFEALHLPRLVALIDPANAASLRVARKLGMAYEADVMLPGYDHPDHLYVTAPAAGGPGAAP